MITRTELAKHLLFRQRLFERNCHLTGSAIEPDKRRRKRAVRELTEAGLITALGGDEYEVTAKVLNEYPAESCSSADLFAIWQQRRELSGGGRERDEPYVILGQYALWDPITVGQLRLLTEAPAAVEWFVCTSWKSALYRTGEYLRGPLTLAQVPAAMSALYTLRLNDIVVAISTPGLRELVAEELFDERVRQLYPVNLAWGLRHLGILTEAEAKLIVPALPGLHLFSGSGQVHVGNNPADWEAVTTQSLDRAIERLADLQQRLAILVKLDRGMRAYGGWAKFLADYHVALVAAIRELDSRPVDDDGRCTTCGLPVEPDVTHECPPGFQGGKAATNASSN